MNVSQLLTAFGETLYITFVVSILVFVGGVLLGICLYSLGSLKLCNNPRLYKVVSTLINIVRAIPFIILLIILMPFTNFLTGSITGANAAMPALVIGVIPMFARLVENTMLDLPSSVVELGHVLGLSNYQLFKKVILREAMPAIVGSFTTIIIAIIGYSAMAGVIGAGGLGSFAYTYGFQRNDQLAIFSSTLLILCIVLVVELVGKQIINKIDYR